MEQAQFAPLRFSCFFTGGFSWVENYFTSIYYGFGLCSLGKEVWVFGPHAFDRTKIDLIEEGDGV
jgi:hypothetical protein